MFAVSEQPQRRIDATISAISYRKEYIWALTTPEIVCGDLIASRASAGSGSEWCSEPFGFTVYGDTPVSVSHVFVILRWRREHPHPVFLEQCPMTSLFKGLTQSGGLVLLWFLWERNHFIFFLFFDF